MFLLDNNNSFLATLKKIKLSPLSANKAIYPKYTTFKTLAIRCLYCYKNTHSSLNTSIFTPYYSIIMILPPYFSNIFGINFAQSKIHSIFASVTIRLEKALTIKFKTTQAL